MSLSRKVLTRATFVRLMSVVALTTINHIAMKITAQTLRSNHSGETWIPAAWLETILSIPWFWISIAAEAAVFVIWLTILKSVNLSVAYSISSLNFITVLLASWLVFGEMLSVTQIAGSALILIGISIIGRAADAP